MPQPSSQRAQPSLITRKLRLSPALAQLKLRIMVPRRTMLRHRPVHRRLRRRQIVRFKLRLLPQRLV